MLFHFSDLLSSRRQAQDFILSWSSLQLLLLEFGLKVGSLVICNGLGDRAAKLGRAADESAAAASPGENSCVSFKCLMEINTLSLQCITQCSVGRNAQCWGRRRSSEQIQ